MDTLCKKLLWVALTLALGQGVIAQETVSKKIEKTYKMTDAGELHLENKYGNINLYGWDKDETSVVISVMVNHRKKETADDLLRRIDPIIRESDDFVSIGYEIADKSTGWFANFFEKANPFDYDRSNLQIDYTIYMPANAELHVKNTFGDVFIEDWIGKLKADVEHGNLWINENLNRVDIDMKYGKLRAKAINYGTINLKNGALHMENAKSLKVTSSGTDIQIEKVASLEFLSNKDEVIIDEVGTIYGNTKFSTIEVSRLTKDVDLTLKISDFRVSKILDPKADIAIDQESSEISLNITDFSHRFEATLEEGLVRLPKSFENVDSKLLDKGDKLREINGTYGKDVQGKISITGRKGVVLLKER